MVKRALMEHLESSLIEQRHYLHSHPEVGFNLSNTHDYVETILKSLNIKVISHVGINSLIGIIENGPGPVIGLRADMDALPMNEENPSLSYCSKVPGAMHACGHDAHTAILLTAAHYLSTHQNLWQGTVKLIFQEAEEGPMPGGADGIIKSGYVDDVDVFFGLHCGPQFDSGTFAIKAGPAMASADTIKIKLIGKGSHAAYPHLGIDPVLMQAEVIVALQSIVSRQIDPTENCVITIAQVHAGSTHNVIPESAFMEGTVRTFNPSIRKQIAIAIEATVKSVTDRHGASYEFEYEYGYDALINQSEPTDYLKKIVLKVFGDPAMIELKKPSMGAEDFSKYIIHKTGCLVWLGTKKDSNTAYGLHHPHFNVDEHALLNGAVLFVNLVTEYKK